MSSFFPSLSTVETLAKGAFATAAGLGTLSAGLLYYGQSYLIYPSAYIKIGEDDGVPSKPASYGLHHESVDLKTKDGQTLKCYLLLQKKDLPKATKYSSLPTVPISAIEGATESGYAELADEELVSHRPTVIMFHGNGGNAGHRIPLGMMFQQVMRCNVLGVEYRGYGDSTGTPSENGFAIDAVTALEFVRGDTRLRNTPVILYGQSIGGAVSIDLASRFPGEIAGIILENTFLSLRLLVPHVLPLLGPFRWLCHQRWESAGKIIGMSDVVSQTRVEDRLVGLVKEKIDMKVKEAFKERLANANDVLNLAASQALEGGGGSLARVGKGLGKEYKGIPRETNVLLLSGQSDTLIPPIHMKFLRQVFEARPHTRRTLGLSPLPAYQEGKSQDTVDEERSQFILFPGGTHNDTTAQHGYWNRIGDFIAEVGKEWREQQKLGNDSRS
ncbi:Alpha/Beta hydrolase protein [Lentinula lateritia]|uniref:Alpha/Beta hydrolase protein n=1 Tax=Lentinula lateritia TaxID=40482 RepID=A0ABQ8V8D6_9AGAR|nr:Alpha/Beta hydrolase protein [Lentinula lateritia]